MGRNRHSKVTASWHGSSTGSALAGTADPSIAATTATAQNTERISTTP
jgi:hypothetical protein